MREDFELHLFSPFRCLSVSISDWVCHKLHQVGSRKVCTVIHPQCNQHTCLGTPDFTEFLFTKLMHRLFNLITLSLSLSLSLVKCIETHTPPMKNNKCMEYVQSFSYQTFKKSQNTFGSNLE